MTARDLLPYESSDGGREGSSLDFELDSFGVVGDEGVKGLFRPQDKLLPAFFSEKAEVDFGAGGLGMFVNGLS